MVAARAGASRGGGGAGTLQGGHGRQHRVAAQGDAVRGEGVADRVAIVTPGLLLVGQGHGASHRAEEAGVLGGNRGAAHQQCARAQAPPGAGPRSRCLAHEVAHAGPRSSR